MYITWTHIQICINVYIVKDYWGIDVNKYGKTLSALRKHNVTLAITKNCIHMFHID